MEAVMTSERASKPALSGGMRAALVGGGVLVGLFALAHTPWATGLSARAPDWSLLNSQPLALHFHLTAAIIALAIGTVLMVGPKGRSLHRRLGWAWVVSMAVVAVSSFWLREINPGSFSWIHALSGWTLVVLPAAIYAARSRRMRMHRRTMSGMFYGGLLVAGLFAMMPGRLLWRMIVG